MLARDVPELTKGQCHILTMGSGLLAVVWRKAMQEQLHRPLYKLNGCSRRRCESPEHKDAVPVATAKCTTCSSYLRALHWQVHLAQPHAGAVSFFQQ